MTTRHLDIWKWLLFISLGLTLVRTFAPVSEPLEGILLGISTATLVAFSGTYLWQQHRARQTDRTPSAEISSSDHV
jgi:hypothetical protein